MRDFTKPWCYYTSGTEFDEGRGYVPSIVFQDEAGHYPLRGSQSDQLPYYWGMTLDEAREACDAANEARGLSAEDVDAIMLSSFRAHFRHADAE